MNSPVGALPEIHTYLELEVPENAMLNQILENEANGNSSDNDNGNRVGARALSVDTPQSKVHAWGRWPIPGFAFATVPGAD